MAQAALVIDDATGYWLAGLPMEKVASTSAATPKVDVRRTA